VEAIKYVKMAVIIVKVLEFKKFKCNNCNKNYSIKTNTIFFQTHKSIKLWQEYIELFSQGLSLRKIVEKMNGKIKLQTSFYWRHKILKVLSNINDDRNNKLGGIVEADETFFEESQKRK
jgi:transposase-like protein